MSACLCILRWAQLALVLNLKLRRCLPSTLRPSVTSCCLRAKLASASGRSECLGILGFLLAPLVAQSTGQSAGLIGLWMHIKDMSMSLAPVGPSPPFGVVGCGQ